MPVLLILYMGSIEVSDLIAVDRRVTVVSGTLGDLVSRLDHDDPVQINSSGLNDYFRAAEGIIIPYRSSPLKQVITVVNVSSTGVISVRWSAAYGTGATKKTTYPSLPTQIATLARGKCVVASDTDYAYRPLLGWVVRSTINLHRSSYYMPRYDDCIDKPSGVVYP